MKALKGFLSFVGAIFVVVAVFSIYRVCSEAFGLPSPKHGGFQMVYWIAQFGVFVGALVAIWKKLAPRTGGKAAGLTAALVAVSLAVMMGCFFVSRQMAALSSGMPSP